MATSSNPALSRNPVFNGQGKPQPPQNKTMSAEELRNIYAQPSANKPEQPGNYFVTDPSNPMTYEDTIAKTVGLFAVLLVGAAAGWFIPILGIVGGLVAFVIAIVCIFKKKPSPPLYFAYALFEGMFVGFMSGYLESFFPGIAAQAVLATLCVVAAVLLLFANGKVRTSPRLNKIFLVAILGYFIFSITNFVLSFFISGGGMFGPLRSGTLGIVIGIIAVLLASYSLVMDFELIKNGVENKAPREYGWMAGFGLMVTVVWLYIEILRIIAIFRE